MDRFICICSRVLRVLRVCMYVLQITIVQLSVKLSFLEEKRKISISRIHMTMYVPFAHFNSPSALSFFVLFLFFFLSFPYRSPFIFIVYYPTLSDSFSVVSYLPMGIVPIMTVEYKQKKGKRKIEVTACMRNNISNVATEGDMPFRKLSFHTFRSYVSNGSEFSFYF